jgi:putative ABC transport system permease protein
MPYDIYREGGDGVFVDISENANMLKVLYEDALQLKVVGILRPSEDSETAMVKSAIGYTHELTEYIIREAAEAAVVKAQKASPTVDVLTGLPFKSNTGALSDEKKQENFLAYIAEQPREALADIYVEIQCLNAIVAQLDAQVDKMMAMMQDKDALITQISTGMSGQVGMSEADIAAYLAEMTLEELKEMMRPAMEEQISASIAAQVKAGMAQIPDEQKIALFEAELPKFTLEQNALYYDELTEFSDSTYDANLVRIGSLDLDKPQTINLYASTFEN